MCYVEEKYVFLNKIPVPSKITLQKPHLLKPSLIELPKELRVPPFDFLDRFNGSCLNDEVGEINIIFISNLKDITFSHIMTQRKPMIQKTL